MRAACRWLGILTCSYRLVMQRPFRTHTKGSRSPSQSTPPITPPATLAAMNRVVTVLLFILNAVLSGFLHLPVTLEARDLAHFAAATVGGVVLALAMGGVPLSLTGVLVILPGVLSVVYRQIHPNPAEVAVKGAVAPPAQG